MRSHLRPSSVLPAPQKQRRSRQELPRSFRLPWPLQCQETHSPLPLRTISSRRYTSRKPSSPPTVPPARLPCGRTADFLPEDLNRTDDGLFEERNRLLKKAQRTGQGRNGHGSCRSGRSGNYKTLYGLRVHGRIRVRKGNCLRRYFEKLESYSTRSLHSRAL